MPRRSSSDSLRRIALLAVAAGLAAGIAATGARMTRRRSSSQDTYRCTCGAKYRVSGTDRHRVYWPSGAPDSEPVLGDRCPNCDAPLPSRHEGATV